MKAYWPSPCHRGRGKEGEMGGADLNTHQWGEGGEVKAQQLGGVEEAKSHWGGGDVKGHGWGGVEGVVKSQRWGGDGEVQGQRWGGEGEVKGQLLLAPSGQASLLRVRISEEGVGQRQHILTR